MLREILLSAITAAWGASSEAQPIANPAHSCLESICGPVGEVQPYSYQLEKDLNALEKEREAHSNNTQPQIEYPPHDAQAIASDIINLKMQERDLEEKALNQGGGDATAFQKAQKVKEVYSYGRDILRLDNWRECYIWDQLNFPDTDQIDRTRLMVKAMEVDMKHLFGRLAPGIEAIHIDLPPSKCEFAEHLKDHLRQIRQSTQDRIDLLKKGDLHSAVIVKLAPDSYAEMEEFQRYLNASCRALNLDPRDDEYYPIGDVIRLSQMTVRGKPESREGTIRHELAHSMIGQMEHYEPKIVEKFEDCLSRQHPEPQNKNQLEEDFADLLAMITWKKQNFFCQRLTVDATRSEYSDNTMYSDPEDTHPTNLFRILHLEFIKQGSLSQACKDYLAKIRYPTRFRHCLNPSSCEIF